MESLLATYSSSDEEDDQTPQPPQPSSSSKPSLLSSLPKPQSSSSIFSSLPPPKSTSLTLNQQQPSSSSKSTSETLKTEEDSLSTNTPSSLFSSLPPPKSETTTDFPLPPPKPKRVVQFRPPVPQHHPIEDHEDEDDEDDDKHRKKQTQLVQDTSVKSFLSSMPTPKSSAHTSLGAGASSLGSGRRSIIETEAPTSISPVNVVTDEVSYVSNDYDQVGYVSNNNNYEVVGAPAQHLGGYAAADYGGGYTGNLVDYDTSNWYNSGGEMAATPSVAAESFARLGGKRRKDQPPAEIIEVNQDELMKNRPTEDKSKLTGAAFGPSYQPVSTKGKPSKLHKRKHQIGALYFDMKQKEMELTERRARGFLTKAETHAKYGW